VHARVDLVNTTRSADRIVELAERHREDVTKRALKATEDIRAGARVMIDRVSDHRMSEL